MLKFKLDKLLEDRDWSLLELWRRTGGEISGIRYNTLLAYRHGYIKRMNVADLIKICNALECDLSELIEYRPKKK